MIKKVLIANRGEIAIRVMRSCFEMGINTVAVYSDADRNSMHVRYADEAYHIGPSPSNESYLVQDKIIAAAKQSGADAIHPGYGFLSENSEFSQRCQDEGIIFIGPKKYAIDTMGDKITSRATMIAADVQVVPGTEEMTGSDEEIIAAVHEIGLPVMVKASAGGGGKGMRLVKEESKIIDGVRAARSEALAAFGNDAVYVERYIASPHHIEFQILADQHGNVVHLFERECSVQRRHQKVVEETPSPLMTEELRSIMGEQAMAAAKAVNYEGAGTVEFLVDNDLNYYFLEMNTRLQVEHPITERVVGVDLVKQQILIAQGEVMKLKQDELYQKGHAIECRIYAEDPDNNFMPNPGLIKHITEPTGLGVRLDGYVYTGFEVPIYYDPMMAKLIVWGMTREETIKRMGRALSEYKITGVKTSIPFLIRIMENENFISGNYDTHFIENNMDDLAVDHKDDELGCDIAAITTLIDYLDKLEETKTPIGQGGQQTSGWKSCGRRRNVSRI